MAPESTEGEKSPTWVKCFIRRKSNIEVLMTIYGLMGSYWIVLIRLHEKFRTSIFFFYCFWLEIDRNSMMADIDSHFEGVRTFFLWKFPMLSHFLNLKTITDDSRLRHCLDFETPFLYRAVIFSSIEIFFIHRIFTGRKNTLWAKTIYKTIFLIHTLLPFVFSRIFEKNC